MKAVTLILLTLFLGKGCSNEAQNDLANTTLQYTANSRGLYEKIVIINQKATVSRDRNEVAAPQEIAISDADWQEMIAYFKTIELEKMADFKDPTQKRFFDGAPIANLKIRYQNKNYETLDFDHGHPPVEIEKLVNKIVLLAKTKE